MLKKPPSKKPTLMQAWAERIALWEPLGDGLDPGIAHEVSILRQFGIETYQSCDGSPSHSFPEPTVQFHGDHAEGYRAVTVALQHGLKVKELRRTWEIYDGELNGPIWELTFWPKARGAK